MASTTIKGPQRLLRSVPLKKILCLHFDSVGPELPKVPENASLEFSFSITLSVVIQNVDEPLHLCGVFSKNIVISHTQQVTDHCDVPSLF